MTPQRGDLALMGRDERSRARGPKEDRGDRPAFDRARSPGRRRVMPSAVPGERMRADVRPPGAAAALRSGPQLAAEKQLGDAFRGGGRADQARRGPSRCARSRAPGSRRLVLAQRAPARRRRGQPASHPPLRRLPARPGMAATSRPGRGSPTARPSTTHRHRHPGPPGCARRGRVEPPQAGAAGPARDPRRRRPAAPARAGRTHLPERLPARRLDRGRSPRRAVHMRGPPLWHEPARAAPAWMTIHRTRCLCDHVMQTSAGGSWRAPRTTGPPALAPRDAGPRAHGRAPRGWGVQRDPPGARRGPRNTGQQET